MRTLARAASLLAAIALLLPAAPAVANPATMQPGQIELPTFTDEVNHDDLGYLWDGGYPLYDFRGGGRRWTVELPFPSSSYTEAFFRPGKLTSEMGRYFTLRLPDSAARGDVATSWNMLDLVRRTGAPALPARYWEQPWFRLPYTVFGTVCGATDSEPCEEFSFDRTVTFGEPESFLVAKNRTVRYDVGPGYSSFGSVLPDAEGLRGGTLRMHLLGVPKAVRRVFDVKVVNPRVASTQNGPRMGIVVKNVRAARRMRPFTLRYRLSAVNRAGVRVHSAPAVFTWRR